MYLNTVGLIFDFIVVIFVIAFVFLGIKKGFILRIIKFAGLISSLIIAVMINKPLRELATPLHDNLSTRIGYALVNSNEAFNTKIPNDQKEQVILVGLESLNIPTFVGKYIAKDLAEKTLPEDTLHSVISPYLANIFLMIFLFIVSFVVIYLITFLIRKFFEILIENSIYQKIDKFLGAIMNLIIVFAFLFGLFFVFKFMLESSFFGFTHNFITAILGLNKTGFSVSRILYNDVFIKLYDIYFNK